MISESLNRRIPRRRSALKNIFKTKTSKKIEISRQVRSLVKLTYKFFALEAEDLAIYLGAHVIWLMITCGPIAVNNVNSKIKCCESENINHELGISARLFWGTLFQQPSNNDYKPFKRSLGLRGRSPNSCNCDRGSITVRRLPRHHLENRQRIVNGPRIMTLPRRYRSPRRTRRFLGQSSGMRNEQKSSLANPWREGHLPPLRTWSTVTTTTSSTIST